jgi:hypothetical protein
VPAKVTKLIGLKRPPFLSPTNLIIFACTQNGELINMINIQYQYTVNQAQVENFRFKIDITFIFLNKLLGIVTFEQSFSKSNVQENFEKLCFDFRL